MLDLHTLFDIYDLIIYFSKEHEQIPWLTAGGPAHKVLIEHLHTPQFLSQLEQAAHGRHTGTLEVLHSLILAYASKRIDYDPPAYNGRIQLAIIDHNENCARPLKYGMYCYNIYFRYATYFAVLWTSKHIAEKRQLM